MENAKKNLVFHFGVGRQASFPPRRYVKVVMLVIGQKNSKARAFIVLAYTHMSELRRNSDALSFFHDQPFLHLKPSYFQTLILVGNFQVSLKM
jgi:hypothetical protein